MQSVKKTSRVSGFTLVELLIVTAVIAVMATITVVMYRGSRESARDTRRRNDIKQFQNLFEIYYNANNNYPSGNGDPENLCNGGTLSSGSCSSDPVNTSPYVYRYSSSGSEYILWSQLERPDSSGNTQYFVTCSNGLSGDTTTAPGGSCPL